MVARLRLRPGAHHLARGFAGQIFDGPAMPGYRARKVSGSGVDPAGAILSHAEAVIREKKQQLWR